MRKHLLPIILVALAVASNCNAADITGKVVGVSDGDTITVLQNNTQYKIRLYGIDCPEKHQDFGTKAKQYTSKMVFGKTIKVVPKDTDRYGRVVGVVYIDDRCLNEELIEAGLAWVYRKYCRAGFCGQWLQMESDARFTMEGLWVHPNPVPPWDFRRRNRSKSSQTKTPVVAGSYLGNVHCFSCFRTFSVVFGVSE